MSRVVLAIAIVFTACAGPAESAPAAAKGRVLLELFTSQGCSSCPPADALLSRLGRAGTAGGVDVIPLAYHVDYWNYLGWRDPFSSRQWTDYQRRYATSVAQGRVYTPQLVVNGRAHVVGSRAAQVARTVRRLSRTSTVAISASLSRDKGRVNVDVRVPAAGLRRGRELVVVLHENQVATRVPRGENAGRTLHNDYIVRAVRARTPKTKQTVTFDIAAGWRARNLGAVAFVRDAKTLAVSSVTRAVEPSGR